MAHPDGKPVTAEGIDRVVSRKTFLHLLDLEVSRSRRYQNFFSLVVLKLDDRSDPGEGDGLEDCLCRLSRLLAGEIRESDVLGFLGEKSLGVLLPYADLTAGGATRSRLENSLRFFDPNREGCRVVIEQVCFPRDGTDASELLRKAAGMENLNQRQELI